MFHYFFIHPVYTASELQAFDGCQTGLLQTNLVKALCIFCLRNPLLSKLLRRETVITQNLYFAWSGGGRQRHLPYQFSLYLGETISFFKHFASVFSFNLTRRNDFYQVQKEGKIVVAFPFHQRLPLFILNAKHLVNYFAPNLKEITKMLSTISTYTYLHIVISARKAAVGDFKSAISSVVLLCVYISILFQCCFFNWVMITFNTSLLYIFISQSRVVIYLSYFLNIFGGILAIFQY